MGAQSAPQASPYKDYAAGAIAGSANIISGFPFDSVKVRLQADNCAYRGAWQCFRAIAREEGVSGEVLGGGRVVGAAATEMRPDTPPP